MPEEFNPLTVPMPTVIYEALMLPLSAAEVGLLQQIFNVFDEHRAAAKKRNPFLKENPGLAPMLQRLNTKLTFLLSVICATSQQPELQSQGREHLRTVYELLAAQKAEMEKAGG